MQQRTGANLTTRDRYGGCPDIHFQPTGFFRLENADRWWLVTPMGNVFLSFGVNHVTPGLLQRKENRDFWVREIGLRDSGDQAGLLTYFRQKVRRDLEAFGFNTLGCHSPTEFYEPGFAPYVCPLRFVSTAHWMTPSEDDFLDVFSKEFVDHCYTRAREIALPRKEDRYLIGYSFTDCPILTDCDAAPRGRTVYGASRPGLPTWPRVLGNLGPEAAGKRAYVECMRRIYADDIQEFNRCYGVDFVSFDALREARVWRPTVGPGGPDGLHRPQEVCDDESSLIQVVDRYYSVAVEAIRRVDPNHMIFGDKLNGNLGVPDSIVALAGKHMDLVFYQYYAYHNVQEPILDRWSATTGKALFNGDSSYSVPDEMMPGSLGPQCATQKERARHSLDFAHRAFSRPDFVGWSFCGWMDSWKTHPRQEEIQHSGLQDPFGNYYQPMADAFARFAVEMYDVAAEGRHH